MKVPAEIWQKAQKLEQEMRSKTDATFFDLLEIANLDPKKHLTGNDWRDVCFDGLDLRGLDFRNTRLHKATWAGAQVESTRFEGSTVHETAFHKALDWRKAILTNEQRADIELKDMLSTDEHPSLEMIKHFTNKSIITPSQWVALIKRADGFQEAHEFYKLMVLEKKGANKAALTTLLDKTEVKEDVAIVDSYFTSNPGVEFDAHALATRISKADNEKDAVEIFNRYKPSVPRTQYVYNALIAKFDFYEAADAVFKQMKDDGFELDAISLNKLIWNAVTFQGAKWLYNRVPDPRTLDLTALMKHAKWQDYQPGGEAYELLNGHPEPNEATYNVMIPSCETFENGMILYKQMKDRGFPPSAKTAFPLLKLISLFRDDPIDRAFNLLRIITEDGADIAQNSIVSAVCVLIAKKLPHYATQLRSIRYGTTTETEVLVKLAERFASSTIAAEFRLAIEQSERLKAVDEPTPPPS